MKLNILTICLFFAASLWADFSEPDVPLIDDVFFHPSQEQQDQQNQNTPSQNREETAVSARIVFASGERLLGRIILSDPAFVIPAGENITGRKLSLAYSGISEIEALLWEGKDLGKGAYYFSPCLVSVKMKNGEIYRCKQMPVRIDFADQSGKRNTFFTGFYDYIKNGKWVNSGKKERDYPTKNPHPKTVTGIFFQ